MDQVADSVLNWLRKGGFPLEYQTARSLRAAGFRAEQGRHYIDPLDGTRNREADVVAMLDPEASVRVVLVFECKAASDKPWVVLTTDAHAEPTVPIAGKALAGVLSNPENSEHIIRSALPLTHPWGFAVVEAHGDQGRDRAHAAMEQVVSSAVGIWGMKAPSQQMLALPVLVTEAPLLRFESPDGGDELALPSTWERVRWNGSQAHPQPTLVDIVQRDGLQPYLATMREQIRSLQDGLSIFTGT